MEVPKQSQALSQVRGPSFPLCCLPQLMLVLEHKLHKICLAISRGFLLTFCLGNPRAPGLVTRPGTRRAVAMLPVPPAVLGALAHSHIQDSLKPRVAAREASNPSSLGEDSGTWRRRGLPTSTASGWWSWNSNFRRGEETSRGMDGATEPGGVIFLASVFGF